MEETTLNQPTPKHHGGFLFFIVLVVIVLIGGAFFLSRTELLKGTVPTSGKNVTTQIEGNDRITESQAKQRDALEKKYREALRHANGEAEIKSVHEKYVSDLIKLFEAK